MTTRGGWDDRWTDPVPLDLLGDDYGVGSPRLLPDGKTLIFSARENNSSSDLYLARLVRKDGPVEPIKGLKQVENENHTSPPAPAMPTSPGEFQAPDGPG